MKKGESEMGRFYYNILATFTNGIRMLSTGATI